MTCIYQESKTDRHRRRIMRRVQRLIDRQLRNLTITAGATRASRRRRRTQKQSRAS